ncbi:pentapeptide repeat-containing protein [Mucilaginibacter arboris]|uniref:Pentapeptide repeat-containing protein n=1 Tax=Mucilaginibacter arboris TaxID=2682090 RepID=A0A7K1SVV4_9SPHI|nr:pentapeptide repeat-containing protein [Mucilaginibacter arboris]MVN21423.1 hypothetical protein [Mucilaginibacter arboris]
MKQQLLSLLFIIALFLSSFLESNAQKIGDNKRRNKHPKIDSIVVDSRNKIFNDRIKKDSLHDLQVININPYNPSNKFSFYPTFNSIIYLVKDTFKSKTNFDGAKFKDTCDFSSSKFSSIVSFTEANFSNKLSFLNVEFDSTTNFTRDTFNKSITFSYLKPTNNARLLFYRTCFPSLLDFSFNQQLYNDISLSGGNFEKDSMYTNNRKGWHYINLYNSDVTKIKIDYLHFRLCFYNSFDSIKNTSLARSISTSDICKLKNDPDFRNYIYKIFPYCKYYSDEDFCYDVINCFKRLFCFKPDLNDTAIEEYIQLCHNNKDHIVPNALSDEEISSIYEKEIKALDTQGQKTSEEKLDIEYRDFKYTWNILPHIWNCYGYHKEWVFWWTFIFLSMFTLITSFCLYNFKKNVYEIKVIPLLPPFRNIKDRGFEYIMKYLVKRLWYSFLYTCFIFFPLLLKFENIRSVKFWGIFYIFLMYLLGLFCLTYVAGFVLQK